MSAILNLATKACESDASVISDAIFACVLVVCIAVASIFVAKWLLT